MATQTFPATGTDRATESAAPRQRYRLVLAALIAMIVLSPFLDQCEDSWLLTLLSASVLITVIVSVRGRRYPFWFAVAVAVANLSANLLTLLTKAPWPMLADGVLVPGRGKYPPTPCAAPFACTCCSGLPLACCFTP